MCWNIAPHCSYFHVDDRDPHRKQHLCWGHSLCMDCLWWCEEGVNQTCFLCLSGCLPACLPVCLSFSPCVLEVVWMWRGGSHCICSRRALSVWMSVCRSVCEYVLGGVKGDLIVFVPAVLSPSLSFSGRHTHTHTHTHSLSPSLIIFLFCNSSLWMCFISCCLLVFLICIKDRLLYRHSACLYFHPCVITFTESKNRKQRWLLASKKTNQNTRG